MSAVGWKAKFDGHLSLSGPTRVRRVKGNAVQSRMVKGCLFASPISGLQVDTLGDVLRVAAAHTARPESRQSVRVIRASHRQGAIHESAQSIQ